MQFELVTQLADDLDGSNKKTPRPRRIPWPTLLQDSSISQTLRRLDDATIGVCGTDARRGEGAARVMRRTKVLGSPGAECTRLICVSWWLVSQLLHEERVAGGPSLWLGPRA